MRIPYLCAATRGVIPHCDDESASLKPISTYGRVTYAGTGVSSVDEHQTIGVNRFGSGGFGKSFVGL